MGVKDRGQERSALSVQPNSSSRDNHRVSVFAHVLFAATVGSPATAGSPAIARSPPTARTADPFVGLSQPTQPLRTPDQWHRGTGLLIAGPLVGSVSLAFKIYTTATTFPVLAQPRDPNEREDHENHDLGPVVGSRIWGALTSIGIADGLAMFSGGLAKRARWRAYQDFTRGRLCRGAFRPSMHPNTTIRPGSSTQATNSC